MVGLLARQPKTEATLQTHEEAPQLEEVQWTKDPGLHKLYFYAFALCVASATTGYDGYVGPTVYTLGPEAFMDQNPPFDDGPIC